MRSKNLNGFISTYDKPPFKEIAWKFYESFKGDSRKFQGSFKEIRKTSPPSARDAAMRTMQHETFLKDLDSFLETSLKHSGNILKIHETPLKHP